MGLLSIPIIGPLVGLANSVIEGVREHYADKRKLNHTIQMNKDRLAADRQTHNHDWEMKQLSNAGWKDEVLFFAIIGMYAYSAIDPERAGVVFQRWEAIPDWFRTITMWMVAGVLGVKKIGDYVPPAIAAIRSAWKGVAK